MKMSDIEGDVRTPAFIFLAESIQLSGLSHPVSIGGGARLLPAPAQIRDALSARLQSHTQTRHMLSINPWESEAIPTTEGGYEVRPIFDASRHQYWIVEHWRRLFDVHLQHALELADPGLTPLMALASARHQTSGSVDAHAILNWLEENFVPDKRDFGPDELASLERAWQLLIAFDEQDASFDFIRKAIRDFAALKRVPANMPIYVVGLFAIIEMLLTSQQDKNSGNSLTHQLKEKLTLLGNRFDRPLSHGSHLPRASSMDFKNVVSKLYSYRSKVAHGSLFEFAGDLQVLESHKAVCRLLREVVRKLILQALFEPALIRDLKNC